MRVSPVFLVVWSVALVFGTYAWFAIVVAMRRARQSRQLLSMRSDPLVQAVIESQRAALPPLAARRDLGSDAAETPAADVSKFPAFM